MCLLVLMTQSLSSAGTSDHAAGTSDHAGGAANPSNISGSDARVGLGQSVAPVVPQHRESPEEAVHRTATDKAAANKRLVEARELASKQRKGNCQEDDILCNSTAGDGPDGPCCSTDICVGLGHVMQWCAQHWRWSQQVAIYMYVCLHSLCAAGTTRAALTYASSIATWPKTSKSRHGLLRPLRPSRRSTLAARCTNSCTHAFTHSCTSMQPFWPSALASEPFAACRRWALRVTMIRRRSATSRTASVLRHTRWPRKKQQCHLRTALSQGTFTRLTIQACFLASTVRFGSRRKWSLSRVAAPCSRDYIGATTPATSSSI